MLAVLSFWLRNSGVVMHERREGGKKPRLLANIYLYLQGALARCQAYGVLSAELAQQWRFSICACAASRQYPGGGSIFIEFVGCDLVFAPGSACVVNDDGWIMFSDL